MALELAPVSGPDRARAAAARRRRVLRRDVADALARARWYVAVGPAPTGDDGLGGAEQVLAAAVAEILDRLRSEQHGLSGEQLGRLAELAVELQRLHGQVREAALDRAVAALGAIGHSIGRVDGEESVDDRLRRAVRDLVEGGGFDRALVLRFRENQMEAVATHFRTEEPGPATVTSTACSIPRRSGRGYWSGRSRTTGGRRWPSIRCTTPRVGADGPQVRADELCVDPGAGRR